MENPFWFRVYVVLFGIILPAILFVLAMAHYYLH
jgi:hypothetical protein